MVTVGLVVKLTAKSDTAEEVAAFLTEALELANAEQQTPVWMTLRSDGTTFWIVDAFPTVDDRQTHLDGAIAEALFAIAERLLAEEPEIHQTEVLAIK